MYSLSSGIFHFIASDVATDSIIRFLVSPDISCQLTGGHILKGSVKGRRTDFPSQFLRAGGNRGIPPDSINDLAIIAVLLTGSLMVRMGSDIDVGTSVSMDEKILERILLTGDFVGLRSMF
jgi:hypothetical protein